MIMEFFTQQKYTPPPEIQEIFDGNFFKRIKLENPPPILLLKKIEGAEWGGFCSHFEFTELGEIVMDIEYIRPSKINKIDKNWLRHLYLHEASHRLLSDEWHSAKFFCLNLTLNFMADFDNKLWTKCNLYDLQDVNFDFLPTAFHLSFSLARKLSTSNLSLLEIVKRIETELTDQAIENHKNEVFHLQQRVEDMKSKRTTNWILSAVLTSFLWLVVMVISKQ